MPDFPPLLPAGVHRMTLDEIRGLCLETFDPLSRQRERVFDALEGVIRRLVSLGLRGELWVDGSFLTEKPEPKDFDAVLFCDSGLLDGLRSDQFDYIATLLKGYSGPNPVPEFCDVYLVTRYPDGHAAKPGEVDLTRYWSKLFGTSREGSSKGIAALNVGGKP